MRKKTVSKNLVTLCDPLQMYFVLYFTWISGGIPIPRSFREYSTGKDPEFWEAGKEVSENDITLLLSV
jgi:hypothetical protein